MSIYIRAAIVIAFVLFSSEPSLAREWRGITPLRSTRADVVRLLGECSEQREACVFSLDQDNVYILFSGGLRDEYAECAKRLSPETVMFIQVEPKTKLRLGDLHLEKKMLKVFDSSAPMGRDTKGYQTRDGLVIEVFRGRVLQLDYIPDPSDRSLCASYYEEPELFVQTLTVHPPLTVSIDCPAEAVTVGTKLTLRADASVDAKRGPTWAVNAGKIVSGQHTYKIILDVSGLAGQSISVTAEMGDNSGHFVSTSYKILILPNN